MIKDIQSAGGRVTVSLSGQLSVQEVADVREQVIKQIEKGDSNVVFELSDLRFIDSAGLGVLVTIQKRARQKGGDVILKGLSGMVREVFEITRLNKAFEIQ